MKDYMILEGANRRQLMDFVCKKMKEGWEPIGGVMVINERSVLSSTWLQAMILK